MICWLFPQANSVSCSKVQFNQTNNFHWVLTLCLSCSILYKSFVNYYYLEINQWTYSLFLLSGYCGNFHKPDDQIVFVHAIDSDKRPIIMHPRMYIYLRILLSCRTVFLLIFTALFWIFLRWDVISWKLHKLVWEVQKWWRAHDELICWHLQK